MRLWLRQVRMHTRPVYDTYVRTVEQRWKRMPSVDFAIILHGSGDMSPDEAELIRSTPSTFIDWRDKTDKSLTSVHLLNFEAFFASDCDLLGVYDDDACFDAPYLALERIRDLYDWRNEWHSKGKVLGAFGPMSEARRRQAYNDLQGACGELAGPPWMFYGCQFYTRSFLEVVDWRGLLSGLKYWSDFALLMEGHRKGFCCVENDMPCYVHHGAKGKIAKADSWPAAEAIDQVRRENIFLHRWFTEPEYLNAIDSMHQRLIETRLQPRVDDPDNAKHRG